MKKFILLSVLTSLLFIVPAVQAQDWRRPGGWGNRGFHQGWNYGHHRGWNHGRHHGWNHRQWGHNGHHYGWNHRPGAWGHQDFRPGWHNAPRGVAYNNYHTPYGWR
jgi:hypothetical protein